MNESPQRELSLTKVAVVLVTALIVISALLLAIFGVGEPLVGSLVVSILILSVLGLIRHAEGEWP